MNANTALKINDAIDQAIRCGESVEDVVRQVQNALARAIEQRAASDKSLAEQIQAKPDWLYRDDLVTKALGIKPGETLRIEIDEDIA